MNFTQTTLRDTPFHLLDVSLRDGGYCHNWNLSETSVTTIVKYLSSLPIDIIEAGYISDQRQYGCNGTLEKSYLESLRSQLPSTTKIAVMLFQEEPEPLSCLKERSEFIDLVRLPIRPNSLSSIEPILKLSHEVNLKSSVNITKASTYTTDDLLRYVEDIQALSPTMIYLADSRGALYPETVSKLYTKLTQTFPHQPFGFHAHNNLTLALMNSIAALEAGAVYLDSSLCGLGLGAGNLMTELVLFLRHQSTEKFASIIETMMDNLPTYPLLRLSGDAIKYYLSGAINIAQETAESAPNIQHIYQSAL